MTVPTNFYTQQASLLPTGLQSLISGGPQQPAPQMPQGIPQMPYMQPQQLPYNWNQAAQQAAPIYQAPPAPPAPAPIAPPVQAPVQLRQPISMPWQANSINRLSAQ